MRIRPRALLAAVPWSRAVIAVNVIGRARPRSSRRGLARRVDHVPFRPLQDTDDPAAATRYVPVDHGSYRVSPGQVDRRSTGPAGGSGFHDATNVPGGDGPLGGI